MQPITKKAKKGKKEKTKTHKDREENKLLAFVWSKGKQKSVAQKQKTTEAIKCKHRYIQHIQKTRKDK